MPQINSRNLAEVDYDQDSEELTILFQSGSTYVYEAVPPHVYGQLLQSIDPGGYFTAFIKNEFSYQVTG